MQITSFGNLAVKVVDLDAAVAFYRQLGVDVDEPVDWLGSRRAHVLLGGVALTLFEKSVYEDDGVPTPSEGFLHAAFFVDDLDRALAEAESVWGPSVVEGPFGRRRIAFVDAPGIRLEFMEDLAAPEEDGGNDASST